MTVWPLWSGDARAVEWVKDCSDLYMCPYATASRADIALVELRGNGVVAGRTARTNLARHGINLFDTPLASQNFDRDVTKLQAVSVRLLR